MACSAPWPKLIPRIRPTRSSSLDCFKVLYAPAVHGESGRSPEFRRANDTPCGEDAIACHSESRPRHSLTPAARGLSTAVPPAVGLTDCFPRYCERPFPWVSRVGDPPAHDFCLAPRRSDSRRRVLVPSGQSLMAPALMRSMRLISLAPSISAITTSSSLTSRSSAPRSCRGLRAHLLVASAVPGVVFGSIRARRRRPSPGRLSRDSARPRGSCAAAWSRSPGFASGPHDCAYHDRDDSPHLCPVRFR